MNANITERDNGVTLVPAAEIKERKVVNARILIGLLLALMALGTLNLYSASGGSDLVYAQLRHIGVGLVAFVICGWFVHPRHLNTYAYWLFGITLVLLAAVLLFGKVAGGSQRWLALGPLRMQPSEFAKLTTIIIVARFFATSRQAHPYRIRDLLPVIAMVGAIAGLIFPQPDFGTAGFCVLIACAQLLFVRIDWRSISIAAAVAIATTPLLWTFLLEDYQKGRVLTFLNPEIDPQGKGYNALQSLVAIGSGGMTGKGFMKGTQTHLQFLPMSHKDFVFSVFAEEHGFQGGAVLFLLFAGLTYVALEIARQAKNRFTALVAVGLAAFVFLEFVINVAMVLRMFPVVGLPLPFFTYGGSILLTVCIALGLLVSIDRENVGLTKKRASSRKRT